MGYPVFEQRKDVDYTVRACAYLRKSRKDLALYGDDDSAALARQRSIVQGLARREGVVISHYYEEVVSGETIADRPEATAMFAAVWNGEWDAILTVEVERLGRGNQGDQGRIVAALRNSTANGRGGTRVITTTKTYYPTNESDMEFIEFGLFMSARELMVTKRRLQRGKIESVVSGQHIARCAPYGFDKARMGGKSTLTPNSDAVVVRLVFGAVAYGGCSLGEVARLLNHMAIPTSGSSEGWSSTAVGRIVHNPVYVGKIRWGKTVQRLRFDEGLNIAGRRMVHMPDEECIVVDGLHEAIVGEGEFAAAQEAVKRFLRVKRESRLVNPYAALMRCAECGGALRMTIRRGVRYIAHVHLGSCESGGCKLDVFLAESLAALRRERESLAAAVSSPDGCALARSRLRAIKEAERAIASADGGMERAFDMFDRGVIDEEEFCARRDCLARRRKEAVSKLDSLSGEDPIRLARRQLELVDVAIERLGDDSEGTLWQNRALRAVVKAVVVSCGRKWERDCVPDIQIVLRKDV